MKTYAKQILAFLITFLILSIGVIGLCGYLTYEGNIFVHITFALTTLVFFPAFEFWYDMAERFLKIKK